MDDLREQLRDALTGYTLERELGGGGMSRVFVAEEKSLGRLVVVKVLSPELSAAVSIERFKREIALAARLQHPHIVPLLSAGDIEGVPYYTMPFVEGESLRERLNREGEFPLPDVVSILKEVARALAYAHERGVVHRDIKPDNVLLSGGCSMVTDFGVAKAVSASTTAGDFTALTAHGVAIGTPAYMSPEQAGGASTVDNRTDLYAFGCMAYELLTGQSPFAGRSGPVQLAAHLTEEPEHVSKRRHNTPPPLADVVMQCLEKRPADRPRDARELMRVLDGILLTPGATPSVPLARVSIDGRREARDSRNGLVSWIAGPRRVAWLAAVLLIGALSGAASWRWLVAAGDSSLTFNIDPMVDRGVPQAVVDIAISPDGKTLALVARSDSVSRVYMRRLSDPEGKAVAISGTDGASFGAFSPDGTWLAIATADGRLLKVRVDGSAAPLTLARGIDTNGGMDWADNGTIILGTNFGGLQRIPATGGALRQITSPRSAAWGHGYPYVAPDHKTVFFADWGPAFTSDDYLAIGSLETGKYNRTSLLVDRPIGVVDDLLLYIAGGSIMAIHFDARRLAVVGDPVPVTQYLTADPWRSAALSTTGTLVFRRGDPTIRLVSISRDGWITPVTTDENNIRTGGRFSPKGDRIAVDLWKMGPDTAVSDIWTMDLKTRAFTRVTRMRDVMEPDWHPDGQRLLFTTWFERSPALWIQPVDGTTSATMLFQAPEGDDVFAASATPDGRGALFCQGRRFSTNPKTQLFYTQFDNAKHAEQMANDPMGVDCGGRVSPDGQWLAYVALDGETPRVFARRFRSQGPRIEISEGNGARPQWSRDGKRIFYSHAQPADDRRVVMAAEVRANGNVLEVASRERIAMLLRTDAFDVTPDGKSVLTMQESDNRVQIFVTTNWLPQLRARLAGHR